MMRLYVVYDRVAEESGPIFSAPNDGVAQRNYRNLMKSVPPWERAEYRLFVLGSFDPKTMSLSVEVSPLEVPVTFPDVKGELE